MLHSTAQKLAFSFFTIALTLLAAACDVVGAPVKGCTIDREYRIACPDTPSDLPLFRTD